MCKMSRSRHIFLKVINEIVQSSILDVTITKIAQKVQIAMPSNTKIKELIITMIESTLLESSNPSLEHIEQQHLFQSDRRNMLVHLLAQAVVYSSKFLSFQNLTIFR